MELKRDIFQIVIETISRKFPEEFKLNYKYQKAPTGIIQQELITIYKFAIFSMLSLISSLGRVRHREWLTIIIKQLFKKVINLSMSQQITKVW